jgi:hypothetical protein
LCGKVTDEHESNEDDDNDKDIVGRVGCDIEIRCVAARIGFDGNK